MLRHRMHRTVALAMEIRRAMEAESTVGVVAEDQSVLSVALCAASSEVAAANHPQTVNSNNMAVAVENTKMPASGAAMLALTITGLRDALSTTVADMVLV